MNVFRISFQYFRSRPLHAALSMLLLTLGLGLMVALVSLSDQMKSRLTANANGIGLVVGAKGSPLQLVLCNVFHLDYPTGNIDLKEARPIANHPLVKQAIPLALGDSYRGFRLVGTNHEYPAHYEAEVAQGRLWEGILEVTLGAQVAESLNLKVGDELVTDHGYATGLDAHEEHAFRVVGVLAPTYTILDELVLTGTESFWVSHDQVHWPDTAQIATMGLPAADTLQITSLLLRFQSPMGALQLPRLINTQTNLQAASPAFESARLFSLLGAGVEVIQAFALLVLVVAGMSIFLSLLSAFKERQYDLAVLRVLGATRGKLLGLVLLESVWITGLGGLLGLAMGHGLVGFVAGQNEEAARMGLSSMHILWPTEVGLWGLALGLGALAAVFPAWRAYRMDISDTLASKG